MQDFLCKTLAECRARGFNDISIYVLDTSGRVLVSKTMIGCAPLIPEIAHAKAGATMGVHFPSRSNKDKYVPERAPQLLAMTTIAVGANRPFSAVPGGVLCRDQEGNIMCAVGVSGASADEDEHCAIIGAQSIGLITEPNKSQLL